METRVGADSMVDKDFQHGLEESEGVLDAGFRRWKFGQP